MKQGMTSMKKYKIMNTYYLPDDEKLKFLSTGSQGDHYVLRQTLSFVNTAFEVRKTNTMAGTNRCGSL